MNLDLTCVLSCLTYLPACSPTKFICPFLTSHLYIGLPLHLPHPCSVLTEGLTVYLWMGVFVALLRPLLLTLTLHLSCLPFPLTHSHTSLVSLSLCCTPLILSILLLVVLMFLSSHYFHLQGFQYQCLLSFSTLPPTPLLCPMLVHGTLLFT